MATVIDQIKSVLEQQSTVLPLEVKKVVVKEVLQAYVLDFIYSHRRYQRLNFYGGTCARIVYGLNRLSEDIDLDNQEEIDLSHFADDMTAHLQKTLSLEGAYIHTQKVHAQKGEPGIARYTVKLPILYALGLSPLQDETIHVKVEVSNHQQLAKIELRPIILYGRSFVAKHFTRESLMAGKVLACITRQFFRNKQRTIKGRDFYDLLWYMYDQVMPNETMLRQISDDHYDTKMAFLFLKKKVSGIAPEDLLQDLLPLFIQQHFIREWVKVFHESFNHLVGFYLS